MELGSKAVIGVLGAAVLGAGLYALLGSRSGSSGAAAPASGVSTEKTQAVAEGALKILSGMDSVVSLTGGHQASVEREDGALYLWTISGGAIDGPAHLDNVNWTAGEENQVVLSCKISRKDGTELNGSLRIPVQKAPVLTQFTASPAVIRPGDKAQLSWEGRNIIALVLNPGGQDVLGVTGSFEVQPKESTTYTLQATSRAGLTTSMETTVKVVGPPAITSFQATPGASGAYTITAAFQGGKAEIQADGTVLASGETSPLSAEIPAAPAGGSVTLSVTNELGASVRQTLTFVKKQ